MSVTTQLQRELWTSWASLLRSYAAVHSLGRDHHAVVEVSDDSIIVRYGLRWMRFSHTVASGSDGTEQAFTLTEDGRVVLGGTEDEMDLFAERLASAIITV